MFQFFLAGLDGHLSFHVIILRFPAYFFIRVGGEGAIASLAVMDVDVVEEVHSFRDYLVSEAED